MGCQQTRFAKPSGMPIITQTAGKRGGKPGERTMRKVKRIRTADCVIGGFRWSSGERTVGSLLLGLHDDDGLLHHVGHSAGFSRPFRKELLLKLTPILGAPGPRGFTGRAPGGPRRHVGLRRVFAPVLHFLSLPVRNVKGCYFHR